MKQSQNLPPVGYIVNHPREAQGTQGYGYDYVMAGNGLFIQAENASLTARIRLAETCVRGLAPAREKLRLAHGTIPAELLVAGVLWMQKTPETERYFCIAWEGDEYRLRIPAQQGQGASVRYAAVTGAVAEFHSHARYPAYFSHTDDADEQGFKIYGVIGRLDQEKPQMALRLGVYGYFKQLLWADAFDGQDLRQAMFAEAAASRRNRTTIAWTEIGAPA